jgi:hypothetical protein
MEYHIYIYIHSINKYDHMPIKNTHQIHGCFPQLQLAHRLQLAKVGVRREGATHKDDDAKYFSLQVHSWHMIIHNFCFFRRANDGIPRYLDADCSFLISLAYSQ